MIEKLIDLRNRDEAQRLFGVQDEHLRRLREALGVAILTRDGGVRIRGERRAVERGRRIVAALLEEVRRSGSVTAARVTELLGGPVSATAARGAAGRASSAGGAGVVAASASPFTPLRVMQPKTGGQARYIEAIRAHDIVFAVGPAGTGKTFLAVGAAVEALRSGRVRRLVLVRPAVEAGERLGFLPGDMQAKVDPYLRPMYDALNNVLDSGQLRKLIDAEIVEICPLAYMRGRTLDDAFIILDEAQNTSSEQMKMFLTRMGQRSKIVVTGDVTQTDLPLGRTSGLVEAKGLLRGIPGIDICWLTKEDIVRHPLVQQIVEAYEAFDRQGRRSP